MNFIIVATIKLINFAASIRDYIFYILQKILYEAYSSQKLHFDNLPNIVIKNTDKSIILIRLTNLTSMSLLYNAFSLFAWYSTNLFFSDIILINKEHVPSQGPTIVYGNHNNQFVDGILLIETIQRHVRFVAAAVSMRRAFVGSFIKATGAIPVQRPQDLEKQKGQGHITDLKVNILKGHQTKFTKLTTGSTLFIKGFPQLKIKNVRSDTQVQLQGDNPQIRGQNLPFTFLLKLDYHQLYEQVWKSLKNNECIGIFPEGGSHDRLTVLPLKAGIGIMALGAMEKYGISVKLVPCGFHYYNRQKFRSQAVLQFGPAYQIPLELVELYRTDKKKAISTLLQTLEKMLKSVTMQFDSQQQLFGLYTARQLYQISCQRQITPKQKMDLNRRFAKAYMLLRHYQKYKEQYEKLLSFSNKLQLRGIKLRREDYYGSKFIDFFKTVFYLVKCLLRSIVALPGIVMFGPTTKLIGFLAEKQRNKYLKGSMRKMQGTDVIGSYKIILSSFMLPLTGIIHSILLYFGLKKYTKLDHNTIVKASIGLFALLPVYAFLFVRSYDSFKRSVDRLKLLFMSLFKKNAYKEFNKEKKQLQKKVLAIVEEEGQKVVQNFQKNRILKREELNVAQSKLYIFDKDENQYEFKE